MSHRSLLFSAVFATLPMGGFATGLCSDDAMIVFDGSGSMSYEGFNGLEESRIKEARRAVGRSMPWIAQFRRLGLIIYGPGMGDSCANIDMRFGPTANAAKLIIDEIDTVSPAGMTALTSAVRQAAEALAFRSRPATVVLITDGQETCGGAPCAMADQLLAQANDLTIHVIGFKVRPDVFSWNNPEQKNGVEAVTVAECLSTKTGGKYVSSETVDELSVALETTLGCKVFGHYSPLNARRSARS